VVTGCGLSNYEAYTISVVIPYFIENDIAYKTLTDGQAIVVRGK
jgi:hypothetical protein